MHKIRLIFTGFLLLAFSRNYAQPYQTSVNVDVPFVSPPVLIDGRPTLYYELHITNYSKDTLELKKIEIVNTANASKIFFADSADLLKRFSRPGLPQKENNNLFPPGNSGVIYLEYTLTTPTRSLNLTHLLNFDAYTEGKRSSILVSYILPKPANIPLVVIGPPLKGGPWTAIYEPRWVQGHRRVFYTVNGQARLPGRFAIDFIKLSPEGKLANGDDNSIKNWIGYGSDVLAVKGGIVASVRDNFPESATLSAYKPVAPENAKGNYISLKIGENQYVFYEHLKPGSIKVKPGQKVKEGEVIAALGFTGQTTGPHLHLHVANQDSALGAEGIVFAFRAFEELGTYSDFGNFGKKPWDLYTKTAKFKKQERPAPNSVIRF